MTDVGWRLFAGSEVAVAVLAAVLGLALQPDTASHPERVGTRVTGCDTSMVGAAQVTYIISNGDRVDHGYRVQLTVASGATPIGSGVSLVTRVPAGTSTTARVLIPVTVSRPGARCTARATSFDSNAGHRH